MIVTLLTLFLVSTPIAPVDPSSCRSALRARAAPATIAAADADGSGSDRSRSDQIGISSSRPACTRRSCSRSACGSRSRSRSRCRLLSNCLRLPSPTYAHIRISHRNTVSHSIALKVSDALTLREGLAPGSLKVSSAAKKASSIRDEARVTSFGGRGHTQRAWDACGSQ